MHLQLMQSCVSIYIILLLSVVWWHVNAAERSWYEVTARVLSDSDFRGVQIMNVVCCVLTHKSWSTGVKRLKCIYYNLIYYQGLMHIQRLYYELTQQRTGGAIYPEKYFRIKFIHIIITSSSCTWRLIRK